MDQERPGVVGDFPGFELVVQGLFSALTLSVGVQEVHLACKNKNPPESFAKLLLP